LTHLASMTLVLAAFGLAIVGVIINGWFAHSLGSTELAGWLFTAVGMAADVASFVLPSCAVRLWRINHRGVAAAAWGTWTLMFAFAITAGIGFASTNIADTTSARAGWITPAIDAAQNALADAKAARDRECGKVGPICRQREDAVAERQRRLDAALQSVERRADPQTGTTTQLVAWASFGWVRPTEDDFQMFRVLLLALLPQTGGLLLMLARSR
jgi:hypothetical protein